MSKHTLGEGVSEFRAGRYQAEDASTGDTHQTRTLAEAKAWLCSRGGRGVICKKYVGVVYDSEAGVG